MELRFRNPINKYKNSDPTKWCLNTQGVLYPTSGTVEERTQGCMQFLKDNYYSNNAKYIKFRPADAKIKNYTKEEIDKWLTFLKSNFDLVFEYDGDFFTIDKSEVKSGFKMYITMILIRYLWYPTYNIIEETYRILEIDKDIDPLQALLLAHYNSRNHNSTFTLFNPVNPFFLITSEELKKDLDSCEKGKLNIKYANYYFGFYAFVNTSDSRFNLSSYFIKELYFKSIQKYYQQNNFNACLGIISDFHNTYPSTKCLHYDTNSSTPIKQPPTLTETRSLEIIKKLLEELFETEVKNIQYFVNDSGVKLPKIKSNSYYMHNLGNIEKLVSYQDYSSNGKYLIGKSLNEETYNNDSRNYPLYLLIFEINEKQK